MKKFNDRGQICFNSTAELAAHVVAAGEGFRSNFGNWVGETREEAEIFLTAGNDAKVPDAERMLDRIEASLDLERPEWSNDVAGAYPDVAAFLAGQPECMRRRSFSISEKCPVRVWVDVTSSASISHRALATRGTAALALVMSLIKQGRAVELLTFTSLCAGTRNVGQTVVVCRMQTAPVNIASVAHCLTSSGFSRGFCYGIARDNGYRGGWAQAIRKRLDGTFAQRVEAVRGHILAGLAGPDDFILPCVHERDLKDVSIFSAPTQWVSDCLKTFAERDN